MKRRLFWTQEKIPEIIKIPKSHCMFCNRYWYHISKVPFMFSIDVGRISMIFEMLFDGSSSFSGACVFPSRQNMKSIFANINMFEKFSYFLILFEVCGYNKIYKSENPKIMKMLGFGPSHNKTMILLDPN